ncbi:hypothetical protein HA402_001676 [Bradysia odoriphaga]|nr:hypothetical protein HA402_001676 [Bradysia odoriphaga]
MFGGKVSALNPSKTQRISTHIRTDSEKLNIEIVSSGAAAEGQYSLVRPMLSAVESHFGPGRAYSHHFAGPAVPSLLPHCPISTLPVLSSTAAAMSAAEFARPHPKPRYSNGPIRNGLTSPRSKYSEQTGPVNLAVSQQQTSTTLSLADTSISVPQTQSNIEPVSPSISNLYGPPKLPYCPPQVTGAHVYPSLNYPSLYARSYG